MHIRVFLTTCGHIWSCNWQTMQMTLERKQEAWICRGNRWEDVEVGKSKKTPINTSTISQPLLLTLLILLKLMLRNWCPVIHTESRSTGTESIQINSSTTNCSSRTSKICHTFISSMLDNMTSVLWTWSSWPFGHTWLGSKVEQWRLLEIHEGRSSSESQGNRFIGFYPEIPVPKYRQYL